MAATPAILTSRECPTCGAEILEVVETERHGFAWTCIDGHAGHATPDDTEDAANPAFDTILELEQTTRIANTIATFAPAGLSDAAYAGRVNAARALQDKLYAAVAALTPDQVIEFGRYRRR